jgi:DNA invertase Pin-like site-specific DNA recombinase
MSRHGWEIAGEFVDRGISGAKGRDRRPGLDRLLKGVARREFDMVAAWSVDRLGRSLQHLVELLGKLHAKGVDLYLHLQGLDTSTPSGRCMFQMLDVFAEFERALIQERVRAGLARARRVSSWAGRACRATWRQPCELLAPPARVFDGSLPSFGLGWGRCSGSWHEAMQCTSTIVCVLS